MRKIFTSDDILQEQGIFDALQKQYLRSFIFAIYLVRICQCEVSVFVNILHISLG